MPTEGRREPTWGEILGQTLGQGTTGLGAGLSALADMKVKELQMQRAARTSAPFWQSKGFTPQESQIIPSLAPQVQSELLKSKRLMGIFQPQDQPQFEQPLIRQDGLPVQQDIQHKNKQAPGGMFPMQQATPTLLSPTQESHINEAKRLSAITGDPRYYENAQRDIFKSREREQQVTQQLSGKEKLQTKDYNRKFKSSVLVKEEEALGRSTRLRRMAQLSAGDKVDKAPIVKLYKKMGLEFLWNPETVEYQKLIADTAREYASKTKGRISEMIFMEFLKSLPSLETSKEARIAVEKTLTELNEMDVKRAQIMRDIIKEKGNITDYDLEDEVAERMNAEYDALTGRIIARTQGEVNGGGEIQAPSSIAGERNKPDIGAPDITAKSDDIAQDNGRSSSQPPVFADTFNNSIVPEEDRGYKFPFIPVSQLPESNMTTSDILRHGVRTAARVGETLAGLPGDIVQLGSSLINLGTHALTGKESSFLKNIPYLPTSSKLRENITTPIIETFAGKGYLDPKGKGESIADELVSDVAAFMFPIKGRMPFARALKTAGLGNAVKWASEKIGVSEPLQEVLKAGSMIGYNFIGPKRLKEFASASRAAAESALPQSAEHSMSKFKPALDKLVSLQSSGDLPARWDRKVASLLDDIAGNKIRVRKVWDLSQDINHAFYGEKPPAAFNRAFKEIKESIYNFMADYGKTNPKFYTNFIDSNSVFSSLAKAEELTSFLNKNLSKGKLGLAAIGSLVGFYSPATLMKYGGGAYIGSELFKTFNALYKSPAARKYWLKTMASANTGNVKRMNAFAGHLDSALSDIMRKR